MSERDENLKTRLEQCSTALQSSEARFRSIIARSADGILIVDGSGIIRFANPAAESIFGRKADELTGEIFGFPVAAGETSELNIVPQKAEQSTIEMRVVETEWGGEQAFVANLRDITERKQMEQDIRELSTELAARAAELETANRDLEAFNYTVAHDLRKPLTVINGYCQALTGLCGHMLDEECNGYIREAYEGTGRMNRLIDDLLDFSQAGQAEPKRQQVNLSVLADEVASELKQAEPERQVSFRMPDEMPADADPALLRVVLSNLFGNAWKYTGNREEGIIEFGMAEIDGRRAYFVRDNGIGFESSDAKKLFEPFQRLDGGKAVGGLGIGLATVARIIQRHGGEVWAEGDPGKGATFYFTLPHNTVLH